MDEKTKSKAVTTRLSPAKAKSSRMTARAARELKAAGKYPKGN